MADHETKLIIKGEDKSAQAFGSAKKSAEALTKELEKQAGASEGVMRALKNRARETHQSYDQLLRNVIKAKEGIEAANKAAEAGNNSAAAATEKHRAAIKAVSGEIVGMVSRYVSLGAAVDGARRAFLGFAESERKLLLIQNQTKATTAEIEASGEKIRDVTRLTQTGFDETVAAANRLRNGLDISFNDAIEKTTRLNVVAKGLDVVPEQLAKLTSDAMRNMKIPADQFNQTLEMIAATSRESGIEIKDLIANGSELSEVAASIGYKSRDGLARLYTQLGLATEIMGDTSKGARLLTQTLGQLSSPQIGEAFGIPGQIWQKQIENVKRQGGDVAAFVINKLGTVRDKEAFLAKMGQKERLLFQKLLEENNGEIGKTINNYKRLSEEQQGVADGLRVMGGAQGGIDQLVASVKDLADEFGRLMVTLGVPDIIAMFTKELERLGAVVKWIGQAIKWAKGEGEFPSIVGPGGFHPLAPLGDGAKGLFSGTVQGLSGQGVNEARQKELQQKLAPPTALPGLKPGQGVEQLPGYYKRTSYGGSADSAYLPANFQGGMAGGTVQNASLGGGGGGVSQFSPGGPGGAGTSYGGNQKAVPQAPAATSSEAVAAAQGGSNLSRAAYDSMFKGTPLAGQYDKVVETAKANNVPPATMAAIMAHETGKGTSKMLATKNNPAGLMDPKKNWSTGQSFETIGAGIEAAGRTIGKNYARAGGDIDKMATKYAPVGAANDPGGLNKSWAGGVKKYSSQLAEPGTSKTASIPPGAGANQGTGSQGTGTIPSKFNADVAAMTAAGAKPANIQAYLAQHGVDTSIATCGQFMAQQVRAHGGKPPAGPNVASNWNNWGQAGYQEGAMNVAVKQGVQTGSTGSHVTAAIPIRNEKGEITGYRGVGVNQGKQGIAGRGDYGRDVVSSIPLRIGRGKGEYQIRSYRPPETAAPAAPAVSPMVKHDDQGKVIAPEDKMIKHDRDEQVHVNMKVNDTEVQFARSSMRKQADREVREARWNSYSDIGAA